MKKLLIASAVAAVATAPVAQAKVSISGQVNQAVILSSDLDDVTIVDNNTSGSRFRFKAAKKFGDGMKAGIRYELQAQDTSSSGLSDKLIQEVRYSDVYFSGPFGKIGLGKGDGAANGTFESYGMLGHFMAGNLARLTVGNAITGGVGYRGVDGFSRVNRVRYDSPKFNGLKFAASLDNADKSEAAVDYNGKVLGGKVRARLGFTNGDADSDKRTSGSFAYKHSSGLGLGHSFGDRDDGFDSNWTTLSYQFGKVVAQYNFGEDSKDNEMSVLGLNYKPTKGVEIYLNNVDVDNGDATYLGSRVKF